MRTKEILLELLIQEGVIISPDIDDNGIYSVTLKESKDYEFRIDKVPENSFAIKCDMFPVLNEKKIVTFFRGEKGECKRADYALICESEKRIMFFEITKSSNKTVSEAILQLKGAKCIIDYCEIIAEMFWKEGKIFGGFQCTYYIIYLSMTPRHSFNRRNTTNSSDIDNPRQIVGSSAIFNALL